MATAAEALQEQLDSAVDAEVTDMNRAATMYRAIIAAGT